MKMQEIRHGVESLWESVSEGWDRLRQSAAGALTRFRPSGKSDVPSTGETDDCTYHPSARWAMVGGDVFEDDKRIVVRIEAPGMEKGDFDVQVREGALVVRGEKRFERESSQGRWRVLQCAYGEFERVVPLPAEVVADQASAIYRRGVLKVELPKAASERPRSRQIAVA